MDAAFATVDATLDAVHPLLKTVLMYLGLAVGVKAVGGAVLGLVTGLYTWFLRSRLALKRYGQWAVVTGATDGIGKAYAMELARSGLNVFLISRTQGKLDEVAAEIAAKYKVETKTLAADFSKPASGIYAKIDAALKGLDIGVLINNVGISYDYPEFYLGVSAERLDALIDMNIVSVTRMTSIVLPGMAERKRGAVINISSGSGLRPTPLLTVYSATKAYVDFFTAGLAREYKGKVFFQSVTPYFVVSALSKMKPSLTVPTPAAFARQAVNQIGYEHHTMGFVWHAVMEAVLAALPAGFITEKIFDMHKGLRVRAIKKAEREAAKQK